MNTQETIRRIDNSVDGWRFYEGIDENEAQLWIYPSCTTKIDAVYPKDSFLIQWIREQGLGGQAIFEKAGEEGTEAHVAIDTLLRGENVLTLEMSLKVKRSVQAFIDWYKKFNPKIIASEEMLVHHQLKFAGTRDLLCELNYEDGKEKYQGVYVIDYKTSNSVHDKHKIQNAGYWGCTNPDYKTAILHLGNRTKAGYSFIPYDPIPYFEQFKHFNQTFDMLYPDAKPKIENYPDFFTLHENARTPTATKN